MSDRLTALPHALGKVGAIRHSIRDAVRLGKVVSLHAPAFPSGVSAEPPASTQHGNVDLSTHVW